MRTGCRERNLAGRSSVTTIAVARSVPSISLVCAEAMAVTQHAIGVGARVLATGTPFIRGAFARS